MSRSRRPASFALSCVAVLLLTPLVGGAQPAPPAADPPPEDRRHRLVSKMWWNQPKKIEQLGLGDTQREAMDALLNAFLDDRAALVKHHRQTLGALGDALASGDADVARAQGSAIAEAASAPIRRQVDLRVDVVALLTPDQRQTLASTYPKLLSRLWVRTSPTRGGGSRRAGGGSSP